MDARLPYLGTIILVALGFAIAAIKNLRQHRDINIVSVIVTFAFTSLVLLGIVWLLDRIMGWLSFSERTEIAAWIGAGIGGGLITLAVSLSDDLTHSGSSEINDSVETGLALAFFVGLGGPVGAIVGLIAGVTLVPFLNWLPEASLMGLGIGGGLGGDAGMFATLRESSTKDSIRAGDTGKFIGDVMSSGVLAGLGGAIVGIIIGALVR